MPAYVPPHLRGQPPAGGQAAPRAPERTARSLTDLSSAGPSAAPRFAGAAGGAERLARTDCDGRCAQQQQHMQRALFPGEPHTRRASARGAPLLGTAADLCAAFFHVERCAEARVESACLCGEGSAAECARKSVACVARLAWHEPAAPAAKPRPPLYVARYTNCFRGSSASNVHAEQFVMQDADLDAALAEASAREVAGASLVLTLFLTYQPCHHSSGHDARAAADGRTDEQQHETSCTRALLAWRARALEPRGVRLEVVVPNLYRAFWTVFDSELERQRYAPRVAAARAGLVLLARAQSTALRVVERADWAFLLALCEPAVAAQWRADEAPFSAERVRARAQMDSFVRAALAEAAGDGDDGGAADELGRGLGALTFDGEQLVCGEARA
jgi:hypothetical protein